MRPLAILITVLVATGTTIALAIGIHTGIQEKAKDKAGFLEIKKSTRFTIEQAVESVDLITDLETGEQYLCLYHGGFIKLEKRK